MLLIRNVLRVVLCVLGCIVLSGLTFLKQNLLSTDVCGLGRALRVNFSQPVFRSVDMCGVSCVVSCFGLWVGRCSASTSKREGRVARAMEVDEVQPTIRECGM